MARHITAFSRSSSRLGMRGKHRRSTTHCARSLRRAAWAVWAACAAWPATARATRRAVARMVSRRTRRSSATFWDATGMGSQAYLCGPRSACRRTSCLKLMGFGLDTLFIQLLIKGQAMSFSQRLGMGQARLLFHLQSGARRSCASSSREGARRRDPSSTYPWARRGFSPSSFTGTGRK